MALVMDGATQQAPQPARQVAVEVECRASAGMGGLSSWVARRRQRA
jgi:hypothetical protein